MDLEDYTDNLYERIVSKIREVRKARGLSQKEIAQDLGLNQVTYSDMENGKTKFSVVRLFAVLKYLGIRDFMSEPDSEDALMVIDNVEQFMLKFYQQNRDIEALRHENHEIKTQMQQLLSENQYIKELLENISKRLPPPPEQESE